MDERQNAGHLPQELPNVITYGYHRYEYIRLEEYLDFRHIASMNQNIAKPPNLTGRTMFSPARQS
jgi:hypothetical protein